MENSGEPQLVTPRFDNLTSEDYDSIYCPSEDSFLLIDALERDLRNIIKLKPLICLEIGIGSGVVLTALGLALGDKCQYFGTDINVLACEKSVETGQLNDVVIKTFCCDLTEGIPDVLRRNIDILLFNPPYVPTPSEEIGTSALHSSWAGGEMGREVVNRLFPDIPSLLSEKGVFYLLVEKQNNPDEIKCILQDLGYSQDHIITRKVRNETLNVIKFYK